MNFENKNANRQKIKKNHLKIYLRYFGVFFCAAITDAGEILKMWSIIFDAQTNYIK